MSQRPPEPDEADALVRGARLRAERDRRARLAGEPSVASRLAQIGVLGWMIVLPALLGVLLGRWLDRSFGTALFWTAPLLLLGLAVGCWSAWRWMQRA